MKTKGKYYIHTNKEKTTVMDHKTQRESCLICKEGKECKKAHTAIQLDLIPITTTIKNLTGVVKVQNHDMKTTKPADVWKPVAGHVELGGKYFLIEFMNFLL